ncbi:uncharacterized protein LOC107485010 [Arachis duranensis]|uniref:Uncharacterized protein LOC107485010 n=1 Tax=Arachis duranensis TaxID=130453 RepID=A0A6P4D2I9_ARADU|nr:uncharacterized protein LOC107485010 [Arachis duranensis]
MINGLSMEIGDGRGTRFWEDVWLRGGSLKDMFPRLFSVSNQRGSVIGDCGFWDGLEWRWNFQWRRELFQWELDLLNQLHETLRLVNLVYDREDRVVWKFDKKGVFSTNSFVQELQVELLPEDIASFSFTRTVWKGLVPPRVELFIWFALTGRVNTKERLSRLGVVNQEDVICVLCNKGVEVGHHLFLACEFSWQVWCAWLTFAGRQWSCPGTLKEHFQSWTESSTSKYERKRWMVSFCAIIWNIWLERNMRIFQSKRKGVDVIIHQSFMNFKEWLGVDPFCC